MGARRAGPDDEDHHSICAAGTQMDGSAHEGRETMSAFADCTYCGGEVNETAIDYDYRRQGHLMVISKVPVGVCQQCGEKYFKPQVLKRMDESYHDIFDRHKKPERVIEIPLVSF
jgi:YgiT-type zinc finger domain-containing protein